MKTNVVLEEIKKELNWKERIIANLLKLYTYKIYGIAQKNAINNILSE